MEESAAAPRRHAHPMVTSAAIGACLGLLIAAALGVRYLAQRQESAAFRPLVETATARPGPIRAELVYSGLVQPAQQATITAQQAGPLAALTVQVGQSVKAGEKIGNLAPESLPFLLQQAQADVHAAEARRAQILIGARATEVTSARAALAAAEARLAQLQNPSAADIAAARAAITNAQTAVSNGEATVDGARAQLLGAMASACATLYTGGVPCQTMETPLPQESAETLQSFLQSRVGDIRNEFGQRAVAVLTANTAMRNALGTAAAARDTLAAARARLEAIQNPTVADLNAARAQIAATRDTLEAKLTPPNDADLQAAAAGIARAQAQVAIAEANLARTTLIAPFDGIVTQRLVEPGVNVTPQTPILTIAAKAVEVHITLRDTDAVLITPTLTAELGLAGDPKPLTGRVRAVAPTGDLRAHTVDVTIAADDPTGRLRVGALAQVRLLTSQKADALIVPAAAVVTDATSSQVLVVADSVVRTRTVTLGLRDAEHIEIIDGIRAGDLVVTRGQNALRDGQPVRVAP